MWGIVVSVVVSVAVVPIVSRPRLKDESITLKEILPIVLAYAVWGHSWKNQSVTVHCDNQGTVAAVNSGYSHTPQIMHMLRCLFFIWAHFGVNT